MRGSRNIRFVVRKTRKIEKVTGSRDDKFVLPTHLGGEGRVNCRSLGFPGFPVEVGGVGELHAPFLTERRKRGLVLCRVAGNPGSLGMTKGRAVFFRCIACWTSEQQVPVLRSGRDDKFVAKTEIS